MTVTNQQILDQAQQTLLDVLAGRVESYNALSESARMLKLKELRDTISEYRQLVAQEQGQSIFQPIIEGQLP